MWHCWCTQKISEKRCNWGIWFQKHDNPLLKRSSPAVQNVNQKGRRVWTHNKLQCLFSNNFSSVGQSISLQSSGEIDNGKFILDEKNSINSIMNTWKMSYSVRYLKESKLLLPILAWQLEAFSFNLPFLSPGISLKIKVSTWNSFHETRRTVAIFSRWATNEISVFDLNWCRDLCVEFELSMGGCLLFLWHFGLTSFFFEASKQQKGLNFRRT